MFRTLSDSSCRQPVTNMRVLRVARAQPGLIVALLKPQCRSGTAIVDEFWVTNPSIVMRQSAPVANRGQEQVRVTCMQLSAWLGYPHKLSVVLARLGSMLHDALQHHHSTERRQRCPHLHIPRHLVLCMQSVLFRSAFLSLLFSALYAKCPRYRYYVVLYV